ncbi:MAG: YfiR family protein [Desulfamplus sp.]|nr:YfiR family protein [Desulfamplus sp.]
MFICPGSSVIASSARLYKCSEKSVLFKMISAASLLLYLVFISPCSLHSGEPSREEIQAALVIKFTDFMEWPEDAFIQEVLPCSEGLPCSDCFTIAVTGRNRYGNLFEAFAQRRFQGRKLRVLYCEDIISCAGENIQIIIVGELGKDKLDKLFFMVRDLPVLTIGDFPGFAEKGGMINFYPKPDNRTGFEINLDAKKRSGLKISSHLLRIARIVKQKKLREGILVKLALDSRFGHLVR